MIDSASNQTKPKRKHEASNKSGEKELLLEKLFFFAFELMDSIKNNRNTKLIETLE